MKSSMGITKIAAFRFMLLLHLFLKVKMCVGFVGAVGDSDINYEDSDEWRGGAGRGPPSWSPHSSPSPTAASVPAPANLVRWDGEAFSRGHSGHPPRMHHVRHEQHYLKHRSVKLPGRADPAVVAPEPGPYQAHTVTTTTVNGPPPKPRHAHHGHQQHQQQHHQHHHRPPGSLSPPAFSSAELDSSPVAGLSHPVRSVPQSGEKRDWFDTIGAEETLNDSSGGRGGSSRQVVVSRKHPTPSFRNSAASNALPDTNAPSSRSSPSTGGAKTPARSVNPRSQKYFEDLLTEYKRRSPFYKELHQARSPQMKALAQARGKSRAASDGAKKPNAKVTEADYDYLYDDEVDEEVQNDAAAFGGETSTSASAPSSSTTTVPATTATTTTARSVPGGSGEAGENESGDASASGDSGYSAYYKQAYAMQSNPARKGNNRFNSIARPPPPASTGQLYNQHGRDDAASSAKQARYPQEEYPPLTRFKQASLGTMDAVERSYKSYSNTRYAMQQASLHIQRINFEGTCKVPRPKLVPASLDRTRSFYPPCTILHRCDEDAGCCMGTETCAPKSTAVVELFFYVSPIGSRPKKDAIALSFTNHTECHCVQKGSVQQDPSTVGRHRKELGARTAGGERDPSRREPPGGVVACKCPEPFKPVLDSESQCYCDCVAGARDCIRFKEGLEHFPMKIRSKILNNQCQAPFCEYGPYKRSEGRCPTKGEQMDQHVSGQQR